MHLPRLTEPLMIGLPSPSPSPNQHQSPKEAKAEIETVAETVTDPWSTLSNWSLRFSIHLTLISLFETVFFWHFVSESEDAALIGLVNNYIKGTLTSCANLTSSQRLIISDIFSLFFNQTLINSAASSALTKRSVFNAILFRNSWIYFSGLLTLTGALAVICRVKKYHLDWRSLIGENIALVTLLGLYEWMYFSTVILQYEAISISELDSMLMNEITMAC